MGNSSNPQRARSVVLLCGLAAWTVGVGDLTQRDGATAPSSDGEGRTRVLHTRTHGEVPDSSASATPAADPYLPDQVMVKLSPSAELLAVSDRHRATPVRDFGPAGWAALRRPDSLERDDFLAALALDPDVLAAAPVGVMAGAGSSKLTAADLQWHLDATSADQMPASDLSDVVVAVLDSGVAYETYSDASGTYVQAPSLAGSPITGAWDFVNDDAHANDDHGHGTHIASTIASDGSVYGVAPGAGLMPLKVLDANNSGNELALIDALHHAAKYGADVVNLSLSFTLGYSPSNALLDAITAVQDAGGVLVAATGNAGADDISWPAAHPGVIAVGAWRMADGEPAAAEYGNQSLGVDVMAPGGSLEHDDNDDGYPDGIVAESIDGTDPTSVGAWAYAGTSQAAAQVSGTAVHLFEAGATADQINAAIQSGAQDDFGKDSFGDGHGAGGLDVRDAVNAWLDSKLQARQWSASLYNYLQDTGRGNGSLVSEVTVVDEHGSGVNNATVLVSVDGSSTAALSCTTDKAGSCSVATADTPIGLASGSGKKATSGTAQAWLVRVDAVVKDDIATHPATHIYVTDALELLLAAIAADPSLDGAVLGYHFDAGADKELGLTLHEAYVALDSGSGLVGSPLGFIFTPPALGGNTPDTVSLDLDGTGLVGSPLGFLNLPFFDFTGSGLVGSPLGFCDFPFFFLGGSGLVGSPLGISGLALFTLDGSGLVGSPLGIWSPGPLPLGPNGPLDLSGTSVGDWFDTGGFVTVDGTMAASGLAASDMAGISATSFEHTGASEPGVQVP